MSLRKRFPGLAFAGVIIASAVARASEPPVIEPVDVWVENHRYVAAESGSAHPGLWKNRLTPYAIKPMRCMSVDHASKRVSVRGSAQTLKSELMLNAIFARLVMSPGTMMMVLPSGDEVSNWNRTKWRPNVKVTPSVNERVIPERARDENASTGAVKEFRGGKLFVTSAGSSKGLQAKSIRDLYFDEISEFPEDTGERGDPIDQARHRQDGQGDDTKELAVSTPKEKPGCRISKMVEAGTHEKYYIPCPTCGHYQVLLFDNFKAEEIQPWMKCAANGCVIEETQKHGFLQYGYEGEKQGAEWLATFKSDDEKNPAPPVHFAPEDLPRWLARDTEGREPSFDIWQAYSTLKPWAKIGAEWLAAQGDPTKLKDFTQQTLAEPYEAAGEAPDHEKLYSRRDHDYSLGGVPFGYWILTGAADIQVDRIEATVWAWAPGWSGFLVAREVFPGKPTDENDECWKALGAFRNKTFEGENGFDFPIDLFTVDAGFATYNVYKFCNGRANTLAVDGRDERMAKFSAPLGPPKHIKKAPARPGRKARPAAHLYPVGAYQLKVALYGALSSLIDMSVEDVAAKKYPPGALRFPGDVTEEDLKQLTAEYLAPEKKKNGQVVRTWIKTEGQANEMLDMYVYARAAAYHVGVGRFKKEEWEQLFSRRGGAGDSSAGGLERMWTAAGLDEAPEAAPSKPKKKKPSGDGHSRRRNIMQRQSLGLGRGRLS